MRMLCEVGKIDILYEDNHIIVVIKPPNLLTQGDVTGDDSLLERVKQYIRVKYNKPGEAYVGMVQRLDRPVGGLIVFAKTSKAASRLTQALKNNEVERKYLAIVHGRAKQNEQLIHWLIKDGKTNMVSAFDSEKEGSKKAILDYRLLECQDDLSLIEVKLHTGRAHQIRVQLASVGLPIYGDMRYGRQEKGRIALWCYQLGLMHPTKKEFMQWEQKPDFFPFDEFLKKTTI